MKAGYKVVVVEQTETTEMMIKRIENQEEIKTKTHFIVDREIYGIYTKGTYQKPIKNKLDEVYDPENYLDNKNVFVYVHDQETNDFGFTYFDVSTLKCVVGQFSDDSMLTKFQTLIATVQPVEVVWSSKLKKTDMTKILFQASSKPSFSFIKADKLLSLKDSKIIIEHYFGGKHKSCPKVVSNIIGKIK